MGVRKSIFGFILAICSALAFGTAPVLAVNAYSAGANPIMIICVNFTLSTVVLFAYIKLKNIDYKIDRKTFFKILILGIIGYAGAAITVYSSYKYIPVGLATILNFTYPYIVAILAYFLYKQKLNALKIASLIMSTVGVFLLIGLSEVRLNIIGVVLAFVSGILWAIYILIIGNSSLKKLNNVVLIFYLNLCSLLVIIYGLLSNNLNLDVLLNTFPSIINVSIMLSAAFFIFTTAIKMIGSTNASILSTLEPITSIALGALILKEQVGYGTALGSALILLAAYGVIINPEDKKKIKIPTPKIEQPR